MTYTYLPNRARLNKLLAIRDETDVSVARQIDFAIDHHLNRYERDPKWRENLMKYAAGDETEPLN